MLEPHSPHQNHLLAALPVGKFKRMCPHLELVELPLGEVLYESGDQLQHVYFPIGSIVSLLYVMANGAPAEHELSPAVMRSFMVTLEAIRADSPSSREMQSILENTSAMGTASQTPPRPTKTLMECIDGYMSEHKQITFKSQKEVRSILQYDADCKTNRRHPFVKASSTAYREEILQQSGMHVTTANKHVSRLSSLFDWAVNHRYASKNIFAGLRLPALK
jgi:hypothetical protein